jgi:hypothetical protein
MDLSMAYKKYGDYTASTKLEGKSERQQVEIAHITDPVATPDSAAHGPSAFELVPTR